MTTRRTLIILTSLITALAAGALAISVVNMNRAATKTELVHVTRQLSQANRSIIVLQGQTTQGAVAALQNDLTQQQIHLSSLEACLPELQNELNGLSINGSYYGTSTAPPVGFGGQVAGWPLTLVNDQQPSPQCQSVLYPTAR